MVSTYHDVYQGWKANPEGFWKEQASEIDWFTPFDRVFDPGQGVYGRWFTGATCNTCYNAIDRHVERGRAGQAAIIYDSPITGSKRTITYEELKEEVEAIREVEREKLDNLEERFGGTKKVRQIEEQIDLLEQVVGSIEEALNSLGGIG